ncbi:uncharacterized protein B0H64DRAFT_31922 [Chaetomium fimeti]|uniref:Uncharacterized protein n=1 Tax=Chaetomium fimeti TaxID=1854472 RepID=A0AAE0HRH7_9PEZI|nr:hypothetical protein B0H64DRAFT_31922 [Chaetomium fimeti]
MNGHVYAPNEWSLDMRTRGSTLGDFTFTFMIEYVGDIYITTFTLGHCIRICLCFYLASISASFLGMGLYSTEFRTAPLSTRRRPGFSGNDLSSCISRVSVSVMWYHKMKWVGYGSHGSCDTDSGAGFLCDERPSRRVTTPGLSLPSYKTAISHPPQHRKGNKTA